MIPGTLQAFYRRISHGDPDSGRIYSAMVQATKATSKYIHSRKVCDLLVGIKNSGMATNDVEHSAKRLSRLLSVKQRFALKMQMMRKKISNAYNNMQEKRRINTEIWRDAKKLIRGEVCVRYLNRWREYIRNLKRSLTDKNERKISWIKKKWMKEKSDDMRGINVEDSELTEEFTSQPRLYGGVQVTEDELAVLSLPPKFGVYKRIDTLQCRIDVEESINKLRWNRIIKKSREGRDDAVIEAKFVDSETRKVDIHALQPRNLPFNPSVAMPRALSLEEEVKIFQVKSEIAKVTEDVARRSVQFSNLTEMEKRGLKSLQQRCNVGEIVCSVTDKSGRWSCDTTKNYKDGCTKLVEDENKTPTITSEEHGEAEQEMNSHALALGRMLGLKDGESGKRLRNAVTAEGTSIAPLYGLRKDHKPEAEDEDERMKRPKMRPICGARDSLTKRTSYLLCKILTPLLEGETTHCDSTDDLIDQFENMNRGEVSSKWVIGSLDVESLYPSLDIPKCVEVVKRKLFNSTMNFENLEWKEIMLYLKFNLKEEEVVKNGYRKYLPTRRYNRRPPIFTRSESNNNMKMRYQPWIFPQQPEEPMKVREMFCEAVATMIRRTMELHDFQIDGVMYKQREGGSIGMDLTGLVSDIYMCEWDKQLKAGMNAEQIEALLYKRYKDDVNMILEVNDNEAEVVEGIGKLMMERVKRVADGVDGNLKVTTDCTENHADGKLPILDLKVWIGTNEEGVDKVLYTHYMKEVASRAVIHYRSSHSPEMKKNVMVNEVMRISRNCSDELLWEEKTKHVSYLAKRMQFSEYPEEVRCKIIVEAIKKYDKVKRKEIHNREMNARGDANHRNKREKQQWYTKDGRYESVMFVEATPKSELAKKIREVMKKEALRIMIVEKAGVTIKGLLQRSNSFGTNHCEREECMICESGCSVDCRLRGCVYEYTCVQCDRKYRGQTGRSVFERNKEHMEAWNRRDDEAPLQRHSNIYHEGERFDVDLRILAKCYGKPSRRMITEAVMIEELPDNRTLNNKNEWTYTRLGKMHLNGQ